jgi:tetratricopeptide (TPR) repeat protein/tRNA A-37 threonylcarbamoyl transferase component Bud32
MRDEGDRDELVMGLVSGALEQSPESRESYLRSACGSDPELYAEIEERVLWEKRMEGFLTPSLIETLELLDRPFEPGELVAGRFRVLNEVGRGGMGVVYEAHDQKLNRRVALKTAVRGHDNRLPPETRAASEVSHFNVCKVHELHSARTKLGEVEFLTMEFIAGETLSARLKRIGPLPADTARDIARQICAGLAQAHRQGVVHGDLKCGNVILTDTAEGGTRAVITDFGLASLKDPGRQDPGRSALCGSFDYMAPELFSGAQPSTASDLYALGVMFHEMLTGRIPQPAREVPLAENASTLTLPRAFGRRARHPRCEKLPRPWGAIVARCLAFRPQDRFSSAGEIIGRLDGRQDPRKWLAAIPAAAAVLAGALWIGKEQPGPPVRLAVLPIAVEGSPVAEAAGLGLELAERLSGARRGFVVIPSGEAQRNKVDTPEKAKTVLAATHVLRIPMRNAGGHLAVRASVVDSGSNISLQELQGTYRRNDIALVAKALTATVTGAFRLQARVPLEVLAVAAYPPYVQGINALQRDGVSADVAIPFLLQAAELDPHSALPQAALAEAYLQKHARHFGGDWLARATDAVTKAQSLNADSAPVLLAAGYVKQVHGWYEQAAQDYSRAVELAPGNPDAWNRLALAYTAMNRPDQAIATYQRALQAQPEYYLPYIDFGVFYRNRAQFAEAEQLFRQVTVIAPNLARGHLLLGLVLQQENRLQEAEQAFLTSLRLREAGAVLTDLGALYYRLEHYDEAERYFAKCLAVDPPTAMRYANLADALRQLGRVADATLTYQKAEEMAQADVEQNPSDPLSRSLYAYILAQLGNRMLAHHEIDQALVMGPGNAEVMRDAALLFEAMHERENTMKVLEQAPFPLLDELNRLPEVRSLQQDSNFQALLRAKQLNPDNQAK